MRVEQLRRDPAIFDRAGGIMFGRPAEFSAASLDLELSEVIYEGAAPNRNRLVVATRQGRRYTVAHVPDSVLLPTVQFVRDGRPVIVNAQSPQGCQPAPRDLRLVELHPGFANTSIGSALIRADFMIWPALTSFGSDARGQRFPAERLSVSSRMLLEKIRALPISFSDRMVSNINDADAPARVTAADGEIRLEGLPRFEILRSATDRAGRVVLESRVSSMLTENQSTLFPAADEEAYLTVVQVYRVAGLLNYLKVSHPEAWKRFAATVPKPARRSTTPSVVCGRCTPEMMFSWLADCRATS